MSKSVRYFFPGTLCGLLLTCVEPANVGLYLIERNGESKQDSDIRGLGFMMMNIMEPESASVQPNVIVLMRPERWSRQIRSFQADTQRHSIRELLFVCEQPIFDRFTHLIVLR
jgi:hypothetical protein